jgi:RES domain-containing protein
MIIYRISSNRFADKLQASGIASRWNLDKQYVLYTSESRALACLENVVHRSMSTLQGLFKTQVILIPDSIKIEIVKEKDLPPGWNRNERFSVCKNLGSAWYISVNTATLRVPSSLIPKENNYIISTIHPDYNQVKLLDVEDFYFDPRIKLAE